MKSLVAVFALILSIACSFGQSTGPLLIQTGTGAGRVANPTFWTANSGTTSTTFAVGNDSRITAASAVIARLLGTGTLTVNTSGTLGTLAFSSGSNVSLTSPTITTGTFSGTNVGTTSAVLDLSASTSSSPLILPSSASIQSIFFGAPSDGVSLGYETVGKKARWTATNLDLLTNGAQGQSKIQLNNNLFDNAITHHSSEGTANSGTSSTPSHREYYRMTSYSGTTLTQLYSGFRGNVSGTNPTLEVYTGTGNPLQPAFPFSWPPATGGNLAARFTTVGFEAPTFSITGTLGGAGTGVPTIYHNTGTTTGLNVTATTVTAQASGTTVLTIASSLITGAMPIQIPVSGTMAIAAYQIGAPGWGINRFGSDIQICRNGVAVATFESGDTLLNGPVYTTFFGAQSAGDVNNASFRYASDAKLGMAFPGGTSIALQTGGTIRAAIDSSGVAVTGNLTYTGTLGISGTAAAPSGTAAPVAWFNATFSGTTFKIPLYQ